MARLIFGGPQVVVKWLGTLAYTAGIALTSANVYPMNLYFQATGAALWVWAALRLRDIPLLAIEALALLMYGAGVIYTFASRGLP